MAKLTLIGFHNYLKSIDDDLWKELTLPDGIDKDVLTNNILLRGGEFEVLYSNPVFMQSAIGIWSAKMQHTFDRWVKALSIEYDPLNNYDRTEEWTTTDSEETNREETTSGSTTSSGSSQSESQSSTSAEDRVSAYNSSTYQPDKTAQGTTEGSVSDSSSNTGTTTGSLNGNETRDNTNVKRGRAYGNIGVTTSQQMLEAELDIAKWNLVDQITDLFLQEFVIPVY